MIGAIGGRKFIYAILVVILGFILVLLKSVPAIDYLHFVEIIGGTYVVGNVGNGIVENVKKT